VVQVIPNKHHTFQHPTSDKQTLISNSTNHEEESSAIKPDNNPLGLPWAAYKYKKVADKVRPIPMVTPEEMKSKKTIPK